MVVSSANNRRLLIRLNVQKSAEDRHNLMLLSCDINEQIFLFVLDS